MKTHGLTHVALAVRDPQRSLAFYRKVIGVVPVYVEDDSIQALTPADPRPTMTRKSGEGR